MKRLLQGCIDNSSSVDERNLHGPSIFSRNIIKPGGYYQIGKERKGKGYIAVPACGGSLAEFSDRCSLRKGSLMGFTVSNTDYQR
eukprot:1037185-Pelagomonas_calceolata.AAC.1